MAPFYGWGSTVSLLEPLWGGILLFTTKFPENNKIIVPVYYKAQNYKQWLKI